MARKQKSIPDGIQIVIEHIDTRMDNVEKKIDGIDSRIDNLDVMTGKQQVILDEHVKRTNLLEDQLRPVQEHVSQIKFAMKIIGLLLAGGVTGAGIKELISLVLGG